MTATRELAGFLAGAGVADSHRARAADYTLDTIGCIVFGAGQPWSQAAAAHARATGGTRGPCPVVGAGFSTTPAMAAFANGASAHAFELDDVHEEAISHPGAVVVPAALAVAPTVGASGREMLDAIVVGYEAMGRAGIAVGPAAHMLAGFHPTGQSGVFGAAAAVGRLLGFDTGTMTNALGLAATFASGSTEFSQTGGTTKRFHAGRAAEGGLTAAMLAAEGVEGPADGLAGRYGFCRTTTTEPAVHLLADRLGDRWMIDEITVKPYAACSDIHPLIDAAIAIRDRGVTAEDIARIRAEVPTKAAEQNALDGTTSVMAAQYSGPFNVAAAFLADPGDPATYTAERIADPALADLQAKVATMAAADWCDATYAWKMAGSLRVECHDGTVHEVRVAGQKGSMHQPLTPDELAAKFRRLTDGRTDADALLTAVGGLDTRTDLTDLLRSLP
jgi:2-methylcitrate dehydratase PrpD